MQFSQIPFAYFDFVKDPPHETAEGRQHWYVPAANFVVEAVHLEPGAILDVDEHPDEYVLILSNDAPTVRVAAGDQSDELGGRSLVIFPPGPSSCEAVTEGYAYRLFSLLSPEYQRAVAHVGEPDRTGVAALEAWPEPSGGYRLRTYRLEDYSEVEGRRRLFRSTNFMVAMGESRTEPRSPRDLSPHSHSDFQQVSLVTQGEYIHHFRRPWGRDSTEWYEDVHMIAGVPSVAVIAAGDVHTSQTVGEGPWYLIDIFGPPRRDYSEKGYVLNADEYPMPTFQDPLLSASASGS